MVEDEEEDPAGPLSGMVLLQIFTVFTCSVLGVHSERSYRIYIYTHIYSKVKQELP